MSYLHDRAVRRLAVAGLLATGAFVAGTCVSVNLVVNANRVATAAVLGTYDVPAGPTVVMNLSSKAANFYLQTFAVGYMLALLAGVLVAALAVRLLPTRAAAVVVALAVIGALPSIGGGRLAFAVLEHTTEGAGTIIEADTRREKAESAAAREREVEELAAKLARGGAGDAGEADDGVESDFDEGLFADVGPIDEADALAPGFNLALFGAGTIHFLLGFLKLLGASHWFALATTIFGLALVAGRFRLGSAR